jgi:hypothetical protein
VLGLLVACSSIKAQDSFELAMENDVFSSRDYDYTHGTMLTLYSGHIPSCYNWTTNTINKIIGPVTGMSQSLGQWIYTPQDRESVPPPSDQRPYAGHLFYQTTYYSENTKKNYLNEFGIQVGIVGPHSYSEESQKEVHKLLDQNYPHGWAYQLKDEPTLGVIYQKKNKLWDNGWSDFITHFGGTVGNANIFANGGFLSRLGYNLPDDYGHAQMEPMPRAFKDKFSLYLLGGVDSRLVGRNIALDGNTFVDSPSVDKEIFVTDFTWGIGMRAFGINLGFVNVYRTAEYEGANDERFGRLSLWFDF